MKLFVPGRICLFGEHSDWAGGYRRVNGRIGKGYAIIAGTNNGLYADVKPHPDKLVIRSTIHEADGRSSVELPMDRDALQREAERGGAFSYAAGVALQVMTRHVVRGLEIDNYLTDLPVKKGLSSSAAICVLVTRAFNRIYDLKLTIRDEMELAYLGEITTPSRCGRMDQGCAYGNRPIMMVFDGDRMEVRELSVKRDLHCVIVDLRAGKDTREILGRLNHCYPFAETDIQRNVQKYLGEISASITNRAAEAMEQGDIERLGALMREAQSEFDRNVAPACPHELTAPVLHKVLSYPAIQRHVLGGKGVGSQGDGTAQFLAKDTESQEAVMRIIEGELGMPCMSLVIRASPRVRKAAIPAAGLGTRMFPATKAVKKELFPIVDSSGRIKPVLLAIVEEAIAAGIEEVCVIVRGEDRALLEDFFRAPASAEILDKLSAGNRAYADRLLDIGRRVTFVTQDAQEGFGHAVYCARDWVGDEPFLLLLGDHLYASDTDLCCAGQMIGAYEKTGKSVVGLQPTPVGEVHNFGCVGGVWLERGSILSVTAFSEKPSAEQARADLAVDGLPEDTFLTVFGMYVLRPGVFDVIEDHIRRGIRERDEIQLTSCLDRVRQDEGFVGLMLKGRRFDIGLPESYRQTLIDYPQVGRRKR